MCISWLCTPPSDSRPRMCSALPCSGGFHRLGQRGVGEKIATADGAIDARDFLVHHTAGADIQMADLGVAHLSAAGRPTLRRHGWWCGGRFARVCPSWVFGAGDGLLSGLSLQPKPSRIMSKTGVTFMLEFFCRFKFARIMYIILLYFNNNRIILILLTYLSILKCSLRRRANGI